MIREKVRVPKEQGVYMRKLDITATILIFIGAINWGFVGLFDVNMIHVFIENETGDRFLYSVVGLAAIYKAIYWKSIRIRGKGQ